LESIDSVDSGNDVLGLVAAGAVMKQAPKRPLIFRNLIDAGNAQLRLPEEGVVRTFEYLSLPGNRTDDGFQ
jgi:hypothetical protein